MDSATVSWQGIGTTKEECRARGKIQFSNKKSREKKIGFRLLG